MSNLDLWEEVRTCPKEAQKEIKGGRLSGMTDINPVWRMKTLTEQFGPCGIGWYYDITDRWTENGDNGQIAVFVQINLYVKDKEWSKPIVGVGGSMFIAKEKSGLYTSDEAYKMALTDAISVSCKALGIAADIYWSKDNTKYTDTEELKESPENKPSITEADRKEMAKLNIKIENLAKYLQCKPEEITHDQIAKAIKTKKEALMKIKEAENGKVQ